jgi:transposase
MRYVGIDVANDTLEIYISGESFVVNNDRSGHRRLLKHLKEGDVIGVEPTNTYYYMVSNTLLTKGYTVKLVDSLLSSRYQKLTMRKQTNDKSSAKAISELLKIGKGRELTTSEVDNPLRELTRGRASLVKQRSAIKGKISKEQNKILLRSYKTIQKDYDTQIEKLEEEILNTHPKGIDILVEIPGISHLSARIILAELGDIDRFSNYRQIVSFAGYDPSISMSGTSIHKQGKLSKRGSPYLRHILYLAAFANMISKNVFNAYYRKKIDEGKHFYSAMTATSRKILQIIYALLKSKKNFSDEPYKKALKNKSK